MLRDPKQLSKDSQLHFLQLKAAESEAEPKRLVL